jgi:uncharacterized protein (TIRG00374 family)
MLLSVRPRRKRGLGALTGRLRAGAVVVKFGRFGHSTAFRRHVLRVHARAPRLRPAVIRMRNHLRTVLVLALAVGLLAWFLRGADLAGVAREIQAGRMGFLLLALAATVTTYFFRTLRWLYLLRPLGRPRFSVALRATIIGFGALTLLPARAGEVIRPYLLAREEGLSTTAVFATIIVERLLDMLTVLILFAAFLLLFDPGLASLDPVVFRALKIGGLSVAAGALAVLLVLFVLAGDPGRLAGVARRADRVLPTRIAHGVARLVELFSGGLAVVRQPKRLALAQLLSFPLWLSISIPIWATTHAFHIDMPYTGAYLLMALLVVGVAVPTPGAVGGFHEMYRIGVTTFYGVASDRAVGAAIVLHAISFFPVAIAAVVLMAHEGMNFKGIRRMAEPAPGEQAP